MSSSSINAVHLTSPDPLAKSGAASLILLHGWNHSLEMLRPLGNLLAVDFDVHLIDLPGFGKSSKPDKSQFDRPWGTADYAKAILEYLDSNNLKQVVLVGHSFGGKVSLYLASEVPERVKQLVLINSSGIPRKHGFYKRLKIYSVKTLRTVLKFLKNRFGVKLYDSWFIPRFASPDYKNAGPLLATFVKIVNEDLTERVKKIGAPALLIWGDKDTETPLEVGRRMQQLIAGSKLIELVGEDHVPFLGAGASRCAYYIKNFLTEPF